VKQFQVISTNNLAKMAMKIAGKELSLKYIPGPLGVRSRSSDNTYIKQVLGWRLTTKLIDGMKATYRWIAEQVTERDKV
jgi:nucleoside-diphosphate-sugar epimerase